MLQPLKNRIIEAVPEILELKFGCEVQNGWASDGNPLRKGIFVGQRNNFYEITDGKGVFWKTFIQDNKCIPLGRPIRLADVLLAIEEKSKEVHGIVAEKDAWFLGVIENLIAMYDLRNDDLEKQSPETLAFLEELLCKK